MILAAQCAVLPLSLSTVFISKMAASVLYCTADNAAYLSSHRTQGTGICWMKWQEPPIALSARRAESLFRPEVLQKRANRLEGAVRVTTPMSWHVIGFLLLGGLVAAAVFLVSASYSRVEVVRGSIVLDRGTAAVLPSRRGIIAAVEVSEGQRVQHGQRLVIIRAEEDMADGASVPDRIRDAIERQTGHLSNQADQLAEAALAERSRFNAQIEGLEGELREIEAQIADQTRLLETASEDYANAQRIALNGFLSKRDVSSRETALISQRQQLSQLRQARTAKRVDLTAAKQNRAQSWANGLALSEANKSSRDALAQQAAQSELSKGYAVTAPFAGMVTGLVARPGEPASPDRQLLVVVPENSRAHAELYVPPTASGFIRPGQNVRLALDAFPFERFGTVPAVVKSISGTPVPKDDLSGSKAAYIVTAELPRPWIDIYSRRQRLTSGMTLTGRVVTDRRNLFEWLFEPLLAINTR